MDMNTCFATTESYHTIAYYSHLVPVLLSALLVFFVVFATRFSSLSKVFASFIVSFCLWLVGDVIVWTSSNYHLVNAFWAPLDYINIVFYLLGAYFFAILISKDGKSSPATKVALILLSIPAWWVTFSGHSITAFNQPQCEAFNSEPLTQYKLLVEWLVCAYIVVSAFFAFRNGDRAKKIQVSVVSSALLLFFSVFSVTELISSQTGKYEINLYSLFVLPIFLGMIIYSIVNLKIFQLKLLGTQLLVYVLLAMIASQFFFLENTGNRVLVAVTLVVSIFFGTVLLRNVKKEAWAREKIEKLANELQAYNTHLKELDIQKSEFLSFATHQIRSPLASMKGYASLILEGDVGPISPEMRKMAQTILTSANTLARVVEDYLNITRIELGTMRYDMREIDLGELVEEVVNEQRPSIEAKGLAIQVSIDPAQSYPVHVDADKFKQVLMNVVDNALKYTPKGSLSVRLDRDVPRGIVRFSVTDTGVGMAHDVIPKLFRKFSRAANASESNIHGTGLGLYIAKEVMTAHGGRIWAESEGEGKGSTFHVDVREGR